MSDNKLIYQKMIARLYHNPNYGKAIGAKRKNQFVFNGSLEFPDTGEKLFVDLANKDHAMVACAPSAYKVYVEVTHHLLKSKKLDPYEMDRFFLGQLKHIKPHRQYIDGFVLYDFETMSGTVTIFETDDRSPLFQEFPIIPCFGEKKGRSPDYFGANFDLESRNNNSIQQTSKMKDILERIGAE